MPKIVDLRKNNQNQPKTDPPRADKFEWVAEEFVKYEKNKNWFLLLFVAALILVVVAIILKNLLLVVAIVLSCAVVYLYAKKEPREIKFSLSGKGVEIENKVYAFDELRSFWIFFDEDLKEISFRSKKNIMPYITIPLADQNPVEIRRFLLKFLPERKHQISVIDIWAKRLKF